MEEKDIIENTGIGLGKNNLKAPFTEVVGNGSPVQQAIKMIWNMFAASPMPDNGSVISRDAAKAIMLHLLGTLNSIGMINGAGYHSASVTLLRSLEDAFDCLFAVVHSEENAIKWNNGELKASEAASSWTVNKVIDQNVQLGEYRKSIRQHLNYYSHCSRNQTDWNLFWKSIGEGKCILELNYHHAVISINGYYIDRYLCAHLYEMMDSLLLYYSSYFAKHDQIKKEFVRLEGEIEAIIRDFLNEMGTDMIYMDISPELRNLKLI